MFFASRFFTRHIGTLALGAGVVAFAAPGTPLQAKEIAYTIQNPSDQRGVYTSNLDGSDQDQVFAVSDGGPVVAPEVNWETGKVYWGQNADDGAILRANLDGTSQETVHSGQSGPQAVKLDQANSALYWTNYRNPAMLVTGSQNGTGGTSTLQSVSDGQFAGVEVDPAGGKVYWTNVNSNEIRRANLDGSSPETIVSGDSVYNLDIEGERLYWADRGGDDGEGSLRHANLDGSDSRTILSGLSGNNFAIDKEGQTVYFGSAGSIESINVDGSNRQTVLSLSDSAVPFGVDVVPEPASAALFALGGLALVTRRRRRT